MVLERLERARPAAAICSNAARARLVSRSRYTSAPARRAAGIAAGEILHDRRRPAVVAAPAAGDGQHGQFLRCRRRLLAQHPHRFRGAAPLDERAGNDLPRQREVRCELEGAPCIGAGAVVAAAEVVHEPQRLLHHRQRIERDGALGMLQCFAVAPFLGEHDGDHWCAVA